MIGDEAAFPESVTKDVFGSIVTSQGGLSKREYFAAKCLQGLLSNPDRSYRTQDAANEAVEYADALIAKLNEGGKA